jgi:O-succinylbenzoate synthase
MKIWQSNYQLYPKGSLNQRGLSKFRRGALLRVEFEPGLVGYSDLCPYSAFGDQPFENEIKNLAREILSPLAKRSLYFARLDAEARAEKRSLYGADRIANHYLIGDLLEFDLGRIPLLQGQRYECFKIKIGSDLIMETEMLRAFCEKISSGSKVRLDFNGRLGPERFSSWIDKNKEWLAQHLDYIEDPFLYEPSEWAKASESSGVDLAVDFPGKNYDPQARGAQIIVIKPAIQDENKVISDLGESGHRIVFTHYLDFPVGQMFAYVMAQRTLSSGERRVITCGLQHQDFYEGFSFQEEIKMDGPFIVPPQGYGIGFDQALESQEWRALK